MKIAITGATGLVGNRLVEKLNQEGHQILVFTRNPNKAQKIFPASLYSNLEIVQYTPQESGEWQKSVSGCDGVVNLAGEPIAERWSPQQKTAIMESRQIGTRKLVEAIAMAESKPKVFVSGSAVGYYGTSETNVFRENSKPGNDFLAQVCQNWEAEAQKVTDSGVRLVILRIGIVLANGGALGKMLGPFKMFAGGPIGSGKQWFSWIHRDDLVNLIYRGLQDYNISGVYNATAPHPVRMETLCKTLGNVMNRPSWLPVPDFVLEILLGDGAVVVLEGQQVLPENTKGIGFDYQYAELHTALEDIVN
ncbi:TIGR01777 family protein [Waterburya agarophytonicola K14]|uniref:TIGR01777 family protein n=1 Tax=Waterburya agarophytonicola KI4 TaxID=2874699 RepID=A0A964FH14_9CYAN|nr:TIGR01777 family oxidoreductase [Waterburya agarophytonicola]MCC0177179.1 TIGR01777 family protein [Waterburya agarophytonicola KI4]